MILLKLIHETKLFLLLKDNCMKYQFIHKIFDIEILLLKNIFMRILYLHILTITPMQSNYF